MLYILGQFGIAAFAITGILAAGKKNMDIFSIVLIGMITALGGGTIRDIILDTSPVFWINDMTYLMISFGASVCAFFFIRPIRHTLRFLFFADALGLAVFTILATQKTLSLGFAPPIAIIMGIVTGVAGGMIRDVLTGRMPILLTREFYATPALIGATLYIILKNYFPDHDYSIFYAMILIFLLRGSAIQWNLYYPNWLLYSPKEQKNLDK